MDFSFSAEQEMLRAEARALLDKRCTPDHIALVADGPEGWDPELWGTISELGWVDGGLDFLDEAVLFEEMGAALAPCPYFATAALARPALQGTPASWEGPATLAWAEDHRRVEPETLAPKTAAAESRGDWKLTGTKRLVPDLQAATRVVVVAAAPAGTALFAVDLGAPGVRVAMSATVDSTRRLGSLELAGAEATLVAGPEHAPGMLAGIGRRSRAAAALEAVGIAGRALDMGIAHAAERRQFGKPIGTYQAVSHALADAYTATELARSLSYWAAWCVEQDDVQADAATRAAKAFASEAAVGACERSIQLYGGRGFTWEHALHRYYKRALWIESWPPSGTAARAAIAEMLLDR